MRHTALLLLLLLSATTAVAADDYYVDITRGVNTNPCTPNDPTRARKNIANGLACLKAGDTLILKAGNYVGEHLNRNIPANTTVRSAVQYGAKIVSDGSCGNFFPIEVDNTGVTIDGIVTDATPQNTCGLSQHVRIGPNARNLTLQNMEITGGHATGGASTSIGIGFTGTGIEDVNQGVIIRNTKIHDIGMDGTWQTGTNCYSFYWASSGVLFEGNEIWHIGGYAVHMYCTQEGACTNNIARNNFFHDNVDGILWASGGSNNQFYNNLVINTPMNLNLGHPALMVSGRGASSTNNKVWNNTIYNGKTQCIQLGYRGGTAATSTTVQNNICYKNADNTVVLANANGTNIIDHNSVGAGTGPDPLFVDAAAGNFQLQAGSPAWQAGIVVLPEQQQLGAPPDLGALQTKPGGQLPVPRNLHLVGQ